MQLAHLNYDSTELQIIYRVQFTNVVSSDPTKRTHFWSRWWLYSKAGGRMAINPNTLDSEVIAILNEKIKKLIDLIDALDFN